MPVYCYVCRDCDTKFEVRHSMSFDDQRCIECESQDIFKMPHLQDSIKPEDYAPKIGKVVEDYITDTKREIKKEKKKLKREVR